jgi:hypothetical protein
MPVGDDSSDHEAMMSIPGADRSGYINLDVVQINFCMTFLTVMNVAMTIIRQAHTFKISGVTKLGPGEENEAPTACGLIVSVVSMVPTGLLQNITGISDNRTRI